MGFSHFWGAQMTEFCVYISEFCIYETLTYNCSDM